MKTETEIQSVVRSFSLLEKLVAYSSGASIKRLAEDIGLPKSTVHRLLANLIGLGYVGQSEESGFYRATLKMYEMGCSIVRQYDVVSTARPYLIELSAQIDETIHLAVQDKCELVYVFKAESGDRGMSSRLGHRMPLYSTGLGKAILSTLSQKELRQIWENSDIRAITPNTITDFDAMEKEMALTRQNGWAIDNEENEMGICCVAVPLPGVNGPPAAFSISSLKAYMNEERMQQLADKCLAVKQQIINDLGLSAR